MNVRLGGLLAASLLFATAPAVAQDTIADKVVAASGGASAGTFDANGNDYDILLTALNTAGLTAAVADPNASLTVFAPRDAAFVRLARDLGYTGTDEQGTWNFLVQTLTTLGNGDPIPVLQDILKYHVAPTRISLFQVIVKSLFGTEIDTLVAGATIRPFFLVLRDNEPDLQNPRVAFPLNLSASNGIVHTIDRVLIPVDLP
ncbi:MAG: fasciclin domain-containing protein [Planctomycetes bacterium]|nr:fasciclin domain-containing protein [Planctomycetota bacterium]